jgi:hypothetical protein
MLRRVVVAVGVGNLVLAPTACGTKEARRAEEDRERVEHFCSINPRRDLAVVFAFRAEGEQGPAASALVGGVTRSLLDDPPDAIAADVAVVRAEYDAPAAEHVGLDDPQVAGALDRVNRWMADTCGPSPLGTQPGTTAAG